MAKSFEEVYRLVRKVPRGRVTSYGNIAAMCRTDISPRAVGWAMSASPKGIPWHRVVSQEGRLLIGRRSVALMDLQRSLLEAEGISFINSDQVDIGAHRWRPRAVSPPRRPSRNTLRRT